jgi:hypothetical protein
MAIIARTSDELSQAEITAAQKFVSDHPELTEDVVHNVNELADYTAGTWKVLLNEESLGIAFKNLSEAGRLRLKSVARLRYEQSAQGYTTEQQNILADWLKSRHLVNTPGGDETFENSAAILSAMRGRSFDYHNLDFCLTYLQSKGQRLHWEQRPAQGRENRGHRATSPDDYRWMKKSECNTPGPGLVSHGSNPKFNGQTEREAREAERRRFNPDAKIEADITLAKKIWNEEIAKTVAEGRTHSERARIAQVAQQTPGGPRLQAAAAREEVARIRKDHERGR